MDKGLLQVYTGEGKGKTTAAVGLALRAQSQGLRVIFAQFMKPPTGGEPDALASAGVYVMRFSEVKSPLFNKDIPLEDIRKAAISALDKLSVLMHEYDLVVLDEFIHLIRPGLLGDDEARQFLAARPEGVEVVLTGRGAPEWIMAMADLVTEMRQVKHPADKGVQARKGIEF